METALTFHIKKYIFITIIIYSCSIGEEEIHISIINKFKQDMLYL